MVKKVISIRLDAETEKILDALAIKRETTVSALACTALKRFANFYSQKEGRDITFGKTVVKIMMDNIKEKEMENISQLISDYIISEMESQVGNIDFKVLEERLMKWNTGNAIPFDKIHINDSVMYISNHNMGLNWSHVQCLVYKKLFEYTGISVIKVEFTEKLFKLTIPK